MLMTTTTMSMVQMILSVSEMLMPEMVIEKVKMNDRRPMLWCHQWWHIDHLKCYHNWHIKIFSLLLHVGISMQLPQPYLRRVAMRAVSYLPHGVKCIIFFSSFFFGCGSRFLDDGTVALLFLALVWLFVLNACDWITIKWKRKYRSVIPGKSFKPECIRFSVFSLKSGYDSRSAVAGFVKPQSQPSNLNRIFGQWVGCLMLSATSSMFHEQPPPSPEMMMMMLICGFCGWGMCAAMCQIL